MSQLDLFAPPSCACPFHQDHTDCRSESGWTPLRGTDRFWLAPACRCEPYVHDPTWKPTLDSSDPRLCGECDRTVLNGLGAVGPSCDDCGKTTKGVSC